MTGLSVPIWCREPPTDFARPGRRLEDQVITSRISWTGLLAYPLDFAASSVILLYSVLGLAMYLVVSYFGEFDVIPLAAFTYLILVMANCFIEYGLDIINRSRQGKNDPPALKLEMSGKGAVDFLSADRRFLKQVIFILAGVTLTFSLFTAGHFIAASVLGLLMAIMTPASFAINAVHNSFWDMLNPAEVYSFLRKFGRHYFNTVILFLVASALFIAAFLSGARLMIFLFALSLYVFIVMFRLLGVVLHRKKSLFFVEVDFDEDKKILKEVSDSGKYFDQVFSKALELMRNRREEEAQQIIDRFLRDRRWQDFDRTFSHLKNLENKHPAFSISRDYLPVLMEQKKYFRAFDICEWCLKTDSAFATDNADVLMTMADEAVTALHYRIIARLLENFVLQFKADPAALELLQKALDIAGNKLHDEERFSRLYQLEIIPGDNS